MENVVVLYAGALLLFARSARAQGNNNQSSGNNQPAQNTTPQNTTPQNTPTPTANNTPAQNTTPNNQQTNTPQQNTPTPASNTAKSSTPTVANGPTVNITGVPTGSTSKSSSTGTQTGSSFGLSGLPTIAGYGIPTMIVPDTSRAPFMAQSNLPEGTVFIIVGAVLGFIGVAVLFWRAFIAWSVHRSVKRANEKMYQPETMKLVKPGVGGASQWNQSNLSMDHLSGTPGGTLTKKNNATPRSNIASNAAAARSSSLFFSPTAGPQGAGNHSSTYLPGNRSSSFLPSGFYAAPGAGSPAGGNSATHIGSNNNRYSRHSRYHDHSPPDSPALPPSRGNDSNSNRRQVQSMHASTSSLNLNIPGNHHAGGRAPSANLDDMLGDYPLPNAR